MKICLVSVEIFAWGKYGGFGRATRMIGRELAKRGVQVTAVTPRRGEQQAVESLDGIRVLGFPKYDILHSIQLYKQTDADIYHSQEPSLGTFLAMKAMPNRKHVVTFRDTRDKEDWRTEFRLPTLSPIQVISNWLYEDNWLVRQAVQKANKRFAAAKLLIPKAQAKYHLKESPEFLPTPVKVPKSVQKAAVPTVCFISRWDRRKRPEIFFELARKFSQVRFLAAGKSHDTKWDNYLRSKYGDLPNVKMIGFIDQFDNDKLFKILAQTWIMINTAAREGLPNAFIEAAAHSCAILSAVNPDNFATRFGYHAKEDDFAEGLNTLLENNLWQHLGAKGYQYVREVFICDQAINQHLLAYKDLLGY